MSVTANPVQRPRSRISRLLSDKGLTRKASLNALAAGLDYSARFIVGFFVTPILVPGLGDAMYGVWTVIHRMSDYLTAAGGRSSQALKWFVVNRQGSSDTLEKRDGVGGAVAVWVLFMPLQVLLGVGLVAFVPGWLDIAPEEFGPVRVAAGIVVAGLVARGIVEVPRSVLEGENLGYKRMWITVLLVGLGGVLNVTAIRMGLGLPGLALASFITVALTGFAFFFVARHHVAWFGANRPAPGTVRKFVGLSGWFIAWSLIVRVMMASDTVILGVFASTELVTTYALIRYLPEGLMRFVTVAVFEAIPGLGRMYSSGDRARAASVRGEIMLLTWLTGAVSGATILVWNNTFLGLWVGTEYSAPYVTTLLIVLMVMQFAWIRMDANFINLTLELKEKVGLGAISAFLSLGLATLFVRELDAGIAGVCWGFILGRMIMSVRYPWIIGRAFGVTMRSQARGVLRPALVTFALFALLSRVSTTQVDTWWELALYAPVSGIIFVAVCFFAGFNRDQRAGTYRRFGAVVAGGTS